MGSRDIEEEEKLELKQSRTVVQKKWNFEHKESSKKKIQRKENASFVSERVPFIGKTLIRYLPGTRLKRYKGANSLEQETNGYGGDVN